MTATLTLEEMDNLKSYFLSSMEIELSKLTQSPRIEVDKFIIELYQTMKLHTLFSQQGLSNITEKVFSNTDIRDFILCLTDRFGFYSTCQSLDLKLEFNIILGLVYHSGNIKPEVAESFNIIPERVKNSLERDQEVLRNTLLSNRWITTIILIYLFIDNLDPNYNNSQPVKQQPGQ